LSQVLGAARERSGVACRHRHESVVARIIASAAKAPAGLEGPALVVGHDDPLAGTGV
jgi:hypothetical protein